MAEIGSDPGHIARTQRFDSGIFHGVKCSTCNRLSRAKRSMAGGIVMLELERKTVGKAARLGNLLGRQQSARHRHLEILAHLSRRIGGEGQFDLGFMRQSTRGAGQNLLELLQRRFTGHYSTAILHAAATASLVGLAVSWSLNTCAFGVGRRPSPVREPFTTAAKSLQTAILRR